MLSSELAGLDQELSDHRSWGSVPSGKTSIKKTEVWMKLNF